MHDDATAEDGEPRAGLVTKPARAADPLVKVEHRDVLGPLGEDAARL
jgi:hypothetical protein